MIDDLQEAFNAYQQALNYLETPKDSNLWYAIGVLYDKYASYEHAEEAFTAALKMDPNFERKSEIYYRLAVIYKNQGLYDQSLEYLNTVLEDPPPQLALTAIQYQIALVHLLLNQPAQAKLIFEKILHVDPRHAKSLQQMGWIHFGTQSSNEFSNLDIAIDYLLHSINANSTDSQTWYLLGQCYMLLQNYDKAYDAYKQAVYHDKTNPILWCSIGFMYFHMSQHQDALDAYIRAIQINPCLPKVWYSIGIIYENCYQISDALDAYVFAAELDPNYTHLQERITLLRAQQTVTSPSSSMTDSFEFQEPYLFPSSLDNSAVSSPLSVSASTSIISNSSLISQTSRHQTIVDSSKRTSFSNTFFPSSLLLGSSLPQAHSSPAHPFLAISAPPSPPSLLVNPNPNPSLPSSPFPNPIIPPLPNTPQHHFPTTTSRPRISSQIEPSSTVPLCTRQFSNNMTILQNPLRFSNPHSSSSSGNETSLHNTKEPSPSSRTLISKSNLTLSTPLKLSSNSPLLSRPTISCRDIKNPCSSVLAPKLLRPLFYSHSKPTFFIQHPRSLYSPLTPLSPESNDIVKTDNVDVASNNTTQISIYQLHCISQPSQFHNEQPSPKK